ncbi:hypothetical protein AAMO2058_000284000 [Amorphochlora amoebiformis]|mmetsp:Transcript_27078/g.42974  ORF Transcript_27078/g.42974 Transcript_27078/m.42974 type:complete len:498 (-) Transcript_27078:20-1513(-)
MKKAASAGAISLLTPLMAEEHKYSQSSRTYDPSPRMRSGRLSFASLGGGSLYGDDKNKFTYMGIFILCINTMNGPGLLALPKAFSECGIIPGVFAMIAVAWVTQETASILCDAIMTTQLRTHTVERHWEFTDLAKEYFGSKGESASVLMLSLTLGALAIAQITIVAQALDAMVIAALGQVVGFRYYPELEVVRTESSSLQPFGVNQPMVSTGFIVAMVICIVLGFMDLTSNKLPQYMSFFLLIMFSICATIHISPVAATQGSASLVGMDPSSIIGVAVFNYSVIIAIPSLKADSNPRAGFENAVSMSVWTISILYIFIGVLGSQAYGSSTDNIMDPMLMSGLAMGRFASFAFVWALIPPLPIYTILISRNLEQVTRKPIFSKIMGVLVPWTLALFLYMSEAFGVFVVWTSILVLGFTNYTLPLTIAARAFGGAPGRIGYEGITAWEAWVEELRSTWEDEIGRKALLLNIGITTVLIGVVIMNIRKALCGISTDDIIP